MLKIRHYINLLIFCVSLGYSLPALSEWKIENSFISPGDDSFAALMIAILDTNPTTDPSPSPKYRVSWDPFPLLNGDIIFSTNLGVPTTTGSIRELWTIEESTGKFRKLTSFAETHNLVTSDYPFVLADGRIVYSTNRGDGSTENPRELFLDLWVVDPVDGGKIKLVSSSSDRPLVWGPTQLPVPDGRVVYFSSSYGTSANGFTDSELWAVDLATGVQSKLYDFGDAKINTPAALDDSSLALSINRELYVLNLQNSALTLLVANENYNDFNLPERLVTAVANGFDGQILYVERNLVKGQSRYYSSIFSIDPRTKETTFIFGVESEAHSYRAIENLAALPDGRIVFAMDLVGDANVVHMDIWTFDPSTLMLQRLVGGSE